MKPVKLIDLVNVPFDISEGMACSEYFKGNVRGYNQYKKDLESMNQKEVSADSIKYCLSCVPLCDLEIPIDFDEIRSRYSNAILTYLAGLKGEK